MNTKQFLESDEQILCLGKIFHWQLLHFHKLKNPLSHTLFIILYKFYFKFFLKLIKSIWNFFFSKMILLVKLYNFGVHQIYLLWWRHLDKYNSTIFVHTFSIHFDFYFTFAFSFWRKSTFLADCSNTNIAQLDKAFHLIYILEVVQRVSSTSPSAIQVKVLSTNWLLIRTQGPRLPPRRSRKVKNSTMNN